MKTYLACLEQSDDAHYRCKEHSRAYLQCRMDRQLMAPENLDSLGFSPAHAVKGAVVYDNAKEKAGYTAGKHIHKESKWWFQKSDKKSWESD